MYHVTGPHAFSHILGKLITLYYGRKVQVNIQLKIGNIETSRSPVEFRSEVRTTVH